MKFSVPTRFLDVGTEIERQRYEGWHYDNAIKYFREIPDLFFVSRKNKMSVSIGVWAQNLQSPRPRGVQRVAREISSRFRSSDDVLYYAVVQLSYNYGTIVAMCYPLETYLSTVPGVTHDRDAHLREAGIEPIYLASWKLDAILSFECFEEVWSWPKEALGCHLVCVAYDLIPLRIEEYPGVDRSRFFKTFGSVVEKASLLISISESTARDLILSFPNAEQKSTVVLIAHGNTLLERIARNADSIYFDQSKGDECTISLVGTVEIRKNHQAVFRSIPLIANLIAPRKLRVLVIGDSDGGGNLFGNTFNYILRRAQEHATIEFTGFVDDMELSKFYAKSDVLIFPSLWEGFGIPILEAMSFGLPVVVSDVASHFEVAGSHATYCDPYDIDTIANAVASVLNTQRNAKINSIINAKSWAEEFRWERTAEDYEAAILQIVAKQPIQPLSPFTLQIGELRSKPPAPYVPSTLSDIVHVFVDCEEIGNIRPSLAVEELLRYAALLSDAKGTTIRLIVSVDADVPLRMPVKSVHRSLSRLFPNAAAIEVMAFLRMPADALDAMGFDWISNLILPWMSGRLPSGRLTFSLYRECERLVFGSDLTSALFTEQAAKVVGPLLKGRIASTAVMLEGDKFKAASQLDHLLPLGPGARFVTLYPDCGGSMSSRDGYIQLPPLPPVPAVTVPNLFEARELASYLAERECPSLPLGIYTVQGFRSYLASQAPQIDDGIDVLCIVSADHKADRSIRRFVDELYGPHLAPHDIKVLVVAFQRPDIAPPAGVPFIHINEPASLDLLLAASRVVVSSSSGDPRVRRDAWRAVSAGRPVVMFAMPNEVDKGEVPWIAAMAEPADVATRILDLLASREESERAAAASWEAYSAAIERLEDVSKNIGIDWASPETAIAANEYTSWQPKLASIFRNFIGFVHGAQVDSREAGELLDALFDPGHILTLRRSVRDRFPDEMVDRFLKAVQQAAGGASEVRKPFAILHTVLGLSVELARPLTWDAVAGAQDCGEAVSACLCERPWADFESSWRTGQLEQLQRLLTVSCFDMVIDAGNHRRQAALHGFDSIKQDWIAALRSSGLAALVVGGRDFTPIPDSSIFVTGPVADPRSAYAIASVAVIPPVRVGGAARYTLEAALAAIVNLRPLVLSRESRGLFGRHFPNLVGDMELTYGNPAEAIALVQALRQDKALYDSQVEKMKHLRSHLLKGLKITVPTRPVILDQRWMALGRLIHRVIEEEDGVSVYAKMQGMADRLPLNADPQSLIEWLDALLISRSANLLKTQQAVFQRISGINGTDAKNLFRMVVKALTGKDIRFDGET
ncbi:hypothetical protein A6A40_23640 (plasmid) [Azospirillum humicireducens]|uniref:Glycosyl transferase family 1 domain-containing protein n=1 Tax=Azospirillum humicireducens TaxID=1226968 RepID=A0A2R4VUC8_9PROT|nr:glycosyltransferase family 1 protein [Azospirillum humicireducens]AWB08043.1 hypothetical protein A6A40_23640 [Azospirillum humicireducens]